MNDIFIEDLFCHFFEEIGKKNVILTSIDQSAAMGFYLTLCKGDAVTENQARFILKILNKYKIELSNLGFDYSTHLENPKWKKAFRVIDTSKKVFSEIDKEGKIVLLFQFPFSFKAVFDKEMAEISKKSFWDTDRRLRLINLYDYNPLSLIDFCERHHFFLDDSVEEIFSQIEHIVDHQNDVLPFCVIKDNEIKLMNVSDATKQYFLNNQKNSLVENLLLVKSMAIPLQNPRYQRIEKLAASHSTRFWFKAADDFFDTFKTIEGKICVILNNDNDEKEWIENFVEAAEKHLVPRDIIKVCFRNEKNLDKGFNQWIKDRNLGGGVDKGKIFIFRQKPAKWLLEALDDVKIIVSSAPYPVMNMTTQKFMDSHSCVCYIGKLRPSPRGKDLIVEL